MSDNNDADSDSECDDEEEEITVEGMLLYSFLTVLMNNSEKIAKNADFEPNLRREDRVAPDSDSEDDEEGREIYCSARCKKGCKNCVCSKNGLRCGSKCNCNDCQNTSKEQEAQFAEWTKEKPENFGKDVPVFQVGCPVNLADTVNVWEFFLGIVDKFAIIDDIFVETNEYYLFNTEYIASLSEEQLRIRKLAMEQKKKQRKWKMKKQSKKHKLLGNVEEEVFVVEDNTLQFLDWFGIFDFFSCLFTQIINCFPGKSRKG